MKKYKNLNESEKKQVLKKFNLLTEYSFITKQDDLLLDEDDDTPIDSPVDNQLNTEKPAEQGMGDQPQSDNVDQNIDNEMPEAPEPIEQGVDMELPDGENDLDANDGEIEVDVTDLTKTQAQIDDKVNSIEIKNQKTMELLDKLINKIDQIGTKIEADSENLKKEIELRNPTPTEKLQKRQTLGSPFTQTPEDYWEQKQSEGGYELVDDQKKYEIKSSDLDDNSVNVYKSFGLDDNEINQSLKTIVGY